jgi:hypothetical protein
MKTDDWVMLLATQAGPAPRAAVARRLLPALLLGGLAAVLLSLRWPWQPQPLGSEGAALAVKLGYTGAVALAAAWLCAGLARPVAPLRSATTALAAVVLAMAALALATLAALPAGARWAEVMRPSAWACAALTAGLSLPAMAAGFWALRGLAPTRPRRAGAAVGLMAGALGALGYGLTCPEASAAFVALWYSAAMLLPVALGSALGPRLLRW